MRAQIHQVTHLVISLGLAMFTARAHATQAQGLQWLQQAVGTAGTVMGENSSVATPLQARTETAYTLALLAQLPSGLGVAGDDDQSTESLSRTLLIMSRAGQDTAELRQQLLARQNGDGGFAHLEGWRSNALDTAHALIALDQTVAPEAVGKAIVYLGQIQQGDGAFVLANQSPLYASAMVLQGLQRHLTENPMVSTLMVQRLTSYLLGKQLRAGTWVDGAENAYLNALVFDSVYNYITDNTVILGFANAMLGLQAGNGSWNDDPFATAWVTRALSLSQAQPVDPLQAAFTLTVVDTETTRALEGVSVELFDAGGVRLSQQMTPLNGVVRVSAPQAGTYRIQLSFPGYVTSRLDINLKQGQYLDYGQLTLSRDETATLYRLTGQVKDSATGAPLAGAVVGVAGGVETRTDANGIYQLFLPNAGTYQVLVNNSGYATVQTSLSIAKAGTFTSNFSLATTPFSLGEIKGRVVNASGTPLAQVQLRRDGQVLGETDAQGKFDLKSLFPGYYELVMVKNGYFQGVANIYVQVSAVVDIGSVTLNTNASGVPDTFQSYASITAKTVDNQTSQDISGALLKAELLNGSNAVVQTQYIPIDNVASGSYRLQAGRWNFTPMHPAYGAGTTTVTLTAGQSQALTFRMGFLNYTVTGRVLDSLTGKPLVKAEYKLVDDKGVVLKSGVTDTLGKFSAMQTSPKASMTFSSPLYLSSTRLIDLMVDWSGQADMGDVRLRPMAADSVLPDLSISRLDASGLQTNGHDTGVSGSLSVQLKNRSLKNYTGRVKLSAFIDRNQNRVLDEGEDVVGSAEPTLTLPASYSRAVYTPVTLPVSGTLLFRDYPLSVMVDSDGAIPERNEANNVASTSDGEVRTPVVGSLSPVLKWAWKTSSSNDYGGTFTPLVARLYDTNKDGRIDTGDMPSILIQTGYTGIFVLDGKTGALQKVLQQPEYAPLWGVAWASPAVGDIDGDGVPEIVSAGRDGVLCFRPDGSFKWKLNNSLLAMGTGSSWDRFTLADLDGDGKSEILYRHYVINHDGTVRFALSGPKIGSLTETSLTAADLDMDGTPELITSNGSIYDNKGVLKYKGLFYETGGDIAWTPVVANLTGGKYPNIIWSGLAGTRVADNTGQTLWAVNSLGWATVADLDGDGIPEIGVSDGGTNSGFRAPLYRVYRNDGSVMWESAPNIASANWYGGTAFDFDNDGISEVMYADARNLFLYNGLTGQTIASFPQNPTRVDGNPIVADVDNDGHADIVVAGEGNTRPYDGVKVYSGANNDWAPTRGLWNQHEYYITNINDDQTIPAHEPYSWVAHNTYRVNAPAGPDVNETPDVTASLIRVTDQNGASPASLTVRVGNGGGLPVPTGTPVAFYNGDPRQGGILLGRMTTSRVLATGEYEDVTLAYTGPLAPIATVYVVVNVTAQGAPFIAKDFTSANDITWADLTQAGAVTPRLTQVVTTDRAIYGANEPVIVRTVLDNKGGLPVSALTSTTLLDGAGRTVATLTPQTSNLAAGATQTVESLWNTATVLAGNYQWQVETRVAGALVARTTTPITIAAIDPPALPVSSVTSDKSAFDAQDTINLTSRVRNPAQNQALVDLRVRTRLLNPDGSVRFTQIEALPQLIAGSLRDYHYQVPLRNAPAGSYAIQVAVLATDDTVLSNASGAVEVLSGALTGSGLSGSLTGVRTVVAGEPLTLSYSVANGANAALAGLPVQVLILDAATQQPVANIAATAQDVAQGQQVSGSLSWTSQGAVNTPLVALLQARSGDQWRTLAQQPLTLTLPQPGLAVANDKSSYDAGDTVHSQITVQNPYAFALNALTATTTVRAPDGAVVHTESASLDVAAQAGATHDTAYALGRAAPGNWQVLTVLSDAQGNELARHSAGFAVQSSAVTGKGLSATVQVPAHVTKGETVHFDWTVANQGNAALANVPVRLRLTSAQGDEVAVLVSQIADLAIDASAHDSLGWLANLAYDSTVQAEFQIQLDGQWRTLAQRSLSVAKPVLTAGLRTDKASYGLNDTLVITTDVANQSPVAVTGLQVRTTVSRPDGTVLGSDSQTLDVAAQAQASISISQALARAPAGEWTISSVIGDADGVELARGDTHFTVLSSAETGSGLGATLSAPTAVVKGQGVDFDWRLSNEGNASLANVPVRVLVSDDQTLVGELTGTVDSLAVDASAQGHLSWTADLAYGHSAQASFQIQLNGEWKTLATRTLNVVKPELVAIATSDKTAYSLNDTVNVAVRTTNLSAVDQHGLRVIATLSQPDGTLAYTRTLAADVAAQSASTVELAYPLARGVPGDWTLTVLVKDADGIELARNSSEFAVLSSAVTGSSISATMQAPATAVRGQDVVFDWSLNNQGNAGLVSVPARIVLSDSAHTVVGTLTAGIDTLAVDATAQGQLHWQADAAYDTAVQARFEIQLAGQWKTLATRELTVVKPAVAVTAAADKASYDLDETVSVAIQVSNQSPVPLSGVRAVTTVVRPDGSVAATETAHLDVAAQATVSAVLTHALGHAAPGVWSLNTVVVDAQGVQLARADSTFAVQSSAVTGSGISATVQAPVSAVKGQSVTFDWSLSNQGNAVLANVPVRIVLSDSNNAVLSTLTTTVASLAVDATAQGQLSWLADAAYGATVQARVEIQLAGQWKSLAMRTLSVTMPTVQATATADKSSYGLNDTLGVTTTVANQSPVALTGVQVVTTVSAPDGAIAHTATSTLDVSGQANAMATTSYALGRAAPGNWTVISVVKDADGVELARTSNVFTVESSAITGMGISAAVQAPSSAVKGQSVNFDWTLNNQGNAVLTNTPVRLVLTESSNAVLGTLTTTVASLAQDSSAQGQLSWLATAAYGATVQARLDIQLAGQWKALATQSLKVVQPHVDAAVATDKASYGLNESLTLTATVTNQSPVLLSGVQVVTMISAPDGTVVHSETSTLNVAAQANATATASYSLGRAVPGNWTVTSVVKDADGIELTRSSNTFTVVSSAVTGAGISATVQAPASAIKGQSVAFDWSLVNQGNAALANTPIRLLLSDSNNVVLNTLTTTVTSLAVDATAQGQLNWLVTAPYGATVQARVEIQLAGQWKSLATRTLSVTMPTVLATAVTDKASYGLNESLSVNTTVANQSPVALAGVQVTTTVSAPDGTVAHTATSTLNVAAQANATATSSYALGRAAPGNWTVVSIVKDADGIELARNSTVFSVQSSAVTGAGISAAVQAPASAVKGQSVAFDWSLVNQGNAALANVPVRLVLSDSSNAVLNTLTTTVATLAQDATAQGQLSWLADAAYGATVQARFDIQLAGQWKTLATRNLAITMPTVQATATTDKASYDLNDTLNSTVTVANQSPVALAGVRVTTTITRPDSSVAKTDTVSLNVAAQGQATTTASLALGVAQPGAWTVTSVVTDSAGVELARTVKGFTVQSSTATGSGLTATVTAAPVEVAVGEAELFNIQVRNDGNADWNSVPLTLTITRNQATTPAQVLTVTLPALARGASAQQALSWTPSGQPGDSFTAVLTLSLNGQTKVLASTAFMLKAPTTTGVDLTQDLAGQNRVLVYYSCEHDWYKGLGGWHFGDYSYGCFGTRAATLRSYLDGLGLTYSLVTAESEFVKQFRSGRYNQTWLLGAIEKLPKGLDEELHEAVNRGDSLLLDGGVQTWYNHEIYDIAGVKYRGRLNFSDSTLTPTLPVFTTPTAIGKPHSAGWPLYLKVTTGTVTATYGASQCQSVVKDWIREQEGEDKEFYGRKVDSYAAIVANPYGGGHALSLAFDLVASLNQPAEKTSWQALLQQALAWSLPPVTGRTSYAPHELLVLRSALTNPGAASTVKLRVDLPAGAVWLGAGTVAPDNSVMLSVTLAAQSRQEVLLPVLLPTLAGTHTVRVTVLSGDGTRTLATQEQRFSVQTAEQRLPLVRTALTQLSLGKDDGKYRDKAVKALQDAERWQGLGRYDDALQSLGEAAEQVRLISGRDVTAERLALDLLMKAVGIKWYDTQR